MTKTVMQIIPNGAIETFNDAPLRVNGVTIQPQWAWSDGYRKHVRQQMAKTQFSWDNVRDTHAQYNRWLLHRNPELVP